MKNLLLVLFCLLSIFANAQTYNDSIAKHREKYRREFLEDDHAPLKTKEAVEKIKFFDADESYRVVADFKKTDNAIPFDLATMNGKTKKYVEYGKTTFELKGKKLSLTIYQSVAHMSNPELADYLFVPFTDSTNGNESYMNGRYMDFRMGDIKNNKLVIDFNLAYNPYCAFSGGYSCPKPTEENNLDVGINAGEKKYNEDH